ASGVPMANVIFAGQSIGAILLPLMLFHQIQLMVCAIKFGPEVDELSEAGLATEPGQMVRSPRILAATAALECRRHTTLQVGPAREIIL
ncbi:bile acid:sodium symporter, partial [Rhizobium ruizarguesonis]